MRKRWKEGKDDVVEKEEDKKKRKKKKESNVVLRRKETHRTGQLPGASSRSVLFVVAGKCLRKRFPPHTSAFCVALDP